MKSTNRHSIVLESKIENIFNQVYSNRLNESLSSYQKNQLQAGFEDGINEVLGKLLAKGVTAISGAGDKLKAFGTRIVGGGKKALDYVTAKGNEYYEKGKKLAGDAIKNLQEFKDKLIKDIVEGYDAAVAKIAAGYEAFKTQMTIIYQKTIKAIEESYVAMKDKAAAFAEYIKGAFSEILAKISLLAQSTKEKFLAMKEGFNEWVNKNKKSISESLEKLKTLGIKGIEQFIELSKKALEGGKDVLKLIGILSIAIILGPIILLIAGLKAIPGIIESAKEMISNYINREIEEYKEFRINPNGLSKGKLYDYTNKAGKTNRVKLLSTTNDTAIGLDKEWMTKDDEMKAGLERGFASVLFPDKDGQYTSKSREIAVSSDKLVAVAENLKYLQTFERFTQQNYPKLWESSGSKTVKEVIENYKKEPRLWMMAVDQYYNVITGVQGAMEELEQYYPNWTIEDFKQVYLAIEGELPQE